MALPDNVDPKDVMGEDGVFRRNPSNMRIRENARDQSEIVKAIKGTKRRTDKIVLQYGPGQNNATLPGVAKVRDLDPDQMEALFKTIMRFKPNIYRMHIKLGEYPSARELRDNKVSMIGGSTLKGQINVGESIAEVMSDKRMNVVELSYEIQRAAPGDFMATCQAFGTTSEEYENDEFLSPAILIEFYTNE